MKDKSKVLKTYGYMVDKLQFIGHLGERVAPRLGSAPQLGR